VQVSIHKAVVAQAQRCKLAFDGATGGHGQAGVAGRSIIVGAYNVEPVTIRTATYCTSAEAATLRTTASALVGTVVSATDGYAQTRANTGVIACAQSVTRAKLPGSDTHIFQAVWTLLPEA
jgi:hypothetical protein